jgi:hypothetical protein
MIDIEKYNMILDEGLLLDHYMVLCDIRDGKAILNNKRVQGFINLLHKKGYIEEGILTEKAGRLLGGIPESKGLVIEEVQKTPKVSKEKTSFYDWVIALHKKCEDKLFEKTGRRQVRPRIDGKPYSFLPNPTDLGKVIWRAVENYKLRDLEKIEVTILRYMDKCAKANNWFPILGYYIMKNSMSTMVTDMESDEDEPTDNASIHIV